MPVKAIFTNKKATEDDFSLTRKIKRINIPTTRTEPKARLLRGTKYDIQTRKSKNVNDEGRAPRMNFPHANMMLYGAIARNIYQKTV